MNVGKHDILIDLKDVLVKNEGFNKQDKKIIGYVEQNLFVIKLTRKLEFLHKGKTDNMIR